MDVSSNAELKSYWIRFASADIKVFPPITNGKWEESKVIVLVQVDSTFTYYLEVSEHNYRKLQIAIDERFGDMYEMIFHATRVASDKISEGCKCVLVNSACILAGMQAKSYDIACRDWMDLPKPPHNTLGVIKKDPESCTSDSFMKKEVTADNLPVTKHPVPEHTDGGTFHKLPRIRPQTSKAKPAGSSYGEGTVKVKNTDKPQSKSQGLAISTEILIPKRFTSKPVARKELQKNVSGNSIKSLTDCNDNKVYKVEASASTHAVRGCDEKIEAKKSGGNGKVDVGTCTVGSGVEMKSDVGSGKNIAAEVQKSVSTCTQVTPLEFLEVSVDKTAAKEVQAQQVWKIIKLARDSLETSEQLAREFFGIPINGKETAVRRNNKVETVSRLDAGNDTTLTAADDSQWDPLPLTVEIPEDNSGINSDDYNSNEASAFTFKQPVATSENSEVSTSQWTRREDNSEEMMLTEVGQVTSRRQAGLNLESSNQKTVIPVKHGGRIVINEAVLQEDVLSEEADLEELRQSNLNMMREVFGRNNYEADTKSKSNGNSQAKRSPQVKSKIQQKKNAQTKNTSDGSGPVKTSKGKRAKSKKVFDPLQVDGPADTSVSSCESTDGYGSTTYEGSTYTFNTEEDMYSSEIDNEENFMDGVSHSSTPYRKIGLKRRMNAGGKSSGPKKARPDNVEANGSQDGDSYDLDEDQVLAGGGESQQNEVADQGYDSGVDVDNDVVEGDDDEDENAPPVFAELSREEMLSDLAFDMSNQSIEYHRLRNLREAARLKIEDKVMCFKALMEEEDIIDMGLVMVEERGLLSQCVDEMERNSHLATVVVDLTRRAGVLMFKYGEKIDNFINKYLIARKINLRVIHPDRLKKMMNKVANSLEVQIGVEVLTINTSTRRVAKKLNIKDVAKWFEYEVKTLLRVMYYLKMKEDIDSSDPRFWHRFMMLMSTLGVYKPKKDCLQYDSKMCLKCYNDFHKPNTALHPVQQLMRFTLVEMDVLRTPALGSSMNGMKQMRPAVGSGGKKYRRLSQVKTVKPTGSPSYVSTVRQHAVGTSPLTTDNVNTQGQRSSTTNVNPLAAPDYGQQYLPLEHYITKKKSRVENMEQILTTLNGNCGGVNTKLDGIGTDFRRLVDFITGQPSSPPQDGQVSTGVSSMAAESGQVSTTVNRSPSQGRQVSTAVNISPSQGTQSTPAVNVMPSQGTQLSTAVKATPSQAANLSSRVNARPSQVAQVSKSVNVIPSVSGHVSTAVNVRTAQTAQGTRPVNVRPSQGGRVSTSVKPSHSQGGALVNTKVSKRSPLKTGNAGYSRGYSQGGQVIKINAVNQTPSQHGQVITVSRRPSAGGQVISFSRPSGGKSQN